MPWLDSRHARAGGARAHLTTNAGQFRLYLTAGPADRHAMSIYVRLKRWLRERRELKRAVAASRAHAMAQMQCASTVPQCQLRQVAASIFRREPGSTAICKPKMCPNCDGVPLPADTETCMSCLENAFFVKVRSLRHTTYPLRRLAILMTGAEISGQDGVLCFHSSRGCDQRPNLFSGLYIK